MKSMILSNKDLVMSGNKFVLVDDEDSLVQQITNQITIWKNEWFLSDIGIDYIRFENERFTDKEIISSITQSILRNSNVSLVNSVIVERIRNERGLTITINVETVEGNLVVTI